MLKVKAGAEVRGAIRSLERIYKKEIPAAKASAFAWAGNRALTRASTRIAAKVGVPKWMIRGVGRVGPGKSGSGTKASGSRVGRTKYIPRKDGIYLFFRFRNINPGGTVAKEANWTKTRDGYSVRGVGRFRGVYAVRSRYPARYMTFYKRDGGGPSERVNIEIGESAVSLFNRTVKAVVPAAFKRRFEHEYNRRIKRVGKQRSFGFRAGAGIWGR